MSETWRILAKRSATWNGTTSEKNERYGNGDAQLDRVALNVHFKECEGGYLQTFDKLIEDGVISTRGLKKDAKVIDEMVIEVNMEYFESPIDALSHGVLENAAVGDAGAWERHNRLSLAGTSDTALPCFLNQHPTVRELAFCLDNDPAGREAVAAMARKYVEKGYHTKIILPVGKDFNEDLQARVKQIRAEKQPKSSHRDVTI